MGGWAPGGRTAGSSSEEWPRTKKNFGKQDSQAIKGLLRQRFGRPIMGGTKAWSLGS